MLAFLIGFAILIYSVILHEIAHGYMADRLGDPTARMRGRLTLNPIPHIDPLMSILLPLLLIFSGSPIVFGAAKPVPIDPYNFREGRKDMGLVGLAGPATNLLLAVAAALIFKIIIFIPALNVLSFLLPILNLAIFYNFALAALNLIPIPPLDGSRILAAIVPKEAVRILDSLEPFGLFILFFLLIFPIGGFSLGKLIFGLVSLWMRLLGFPI
jgi:Zn-dependent protease